MKRVRRHVLVRAPGKLFVLGEYAVLDGGTACVAAVDRGVTCRVRAGDRLTTPSGDTRFVAAALAAVRAPTRQYLFEDWNPVDLPDKPGFGGSAAATVAAVGAGLAANMVRFERDWWATIEDVAVRVHLAVQGSGSGLDVRASARGGFNRYAGERVDPLPTPELVACWSGGSAKTGPRVTRFLAWDARERARFRVDSDALADTWEADPVGTLTAARQLLQTALAQAGVDYRTPGLDRIAALAAEHGGAAKPSGAGGGDVAVAVIPDPDARAAFAAACDAEGLTPIPVNVVQGVTLD